MSFWALALPLPLTSLPRELSEGGAEGKGCEKGVSFLLLLDGDEIDVAGVCRRKGVSEGQKDEVEQRLMAE